LFRIAFSGQVPEGREGRSGIAVQSWEVGDLEDDGGSFKDGHFVGNCADRT
jgi:hypothetical protein